MTPVNGANNRIAQLLRNSKWIAVLGVLVLYFCSGILILIGIIRLYYIIHDLCMKIKSGIRIETISLSASFISIIEIYLLSIIFYILAVGIYKLFVGKFTILHWYEIESLDEMKAELAKAIVIFLSVFVLQKIVEWKDPQSIFFIGAAVTFTSANLIWFSHTLKNNKNKNCNTPPTDNKK